MCQAFMIYGAPIPAGTFRPWIDPHQVIENPQPGPETLASMAFFRDARDGIVIRAFGSRWTPRWVVGIDSTVCVAPAMELRRVAASELPRIRTNEMRSKIWAFCNVHRFKLLDTPAWYVTAYSEG